MLIFIFGIFIGFFVLEPFIINFIYLSNISLFEDLILTKKNKERLRDYYFDEFIAFYNADTDFWEEL